MPVRPPSPLAPEDRPPQKLTQVEPPKPPTLPTGPNKGPGLPVLPPTNPLGGLPTVGPTIPPGLEPPKGAARLFYELSHAPGPASVLNSPEQFRYVLTLKPDANDPGYSQALAEMQAFVRRQLGLAAPMSEDDRREAGRAGLSPGVPSKTRAQQERDAKIKALNDKLSGNPFVVDLNGNPVDPDLTDAKSNTGTTQTGSQTNASNSGDLNVHKGPVDTNVLIGTGNYVWMGKASVPGVYGQGKVNQDSYMSKDDLELVIARWSPADIAKFQHAMGLDVNGVVDKDTFAYWKAIVDAAARYTQAGQKVDINWIVGQLARGNEAKKRGGGGGGGGRGGVSAGQATQFLNQYMRQYVGREATDAEIGAFTAAVNAAAGRSDFDPQQFAIDWVKNRAPSEVGSFQAATDYYSAMMQVLGGAG